MGDKSPKAKEQRKQQATTHKKDAKAAALAKATPSALTTGRKPGK